MNPVRHYQAAFAAFRPELPGAHLPWLDQVRRQAMARLAATGFPSLRSDEWRESDLEATLATPYLPAREPLSWDTALLPALDPDAPRIVFVDGIHVPGLDVNLGGITTIRRTLEGDSISLARYLVRPPDRGDHAFAALNEAFLQDGVVIRIPAGVALDPIHIVHLATRAQPAAAYLRHLVLAGEGSRATLVEHHLGRGNGFLDAVTELRAGPGARLRHLRIRAEGHLSRHFSALRVHQDEESRVDAHVVQLGGTGRVEIHGVLKGRQAHMEVSGLYVGAEESRLDNYTFVEHASPGTTSRQLFKGILGGGARGVFNGRVLVRRDAQGIDARQQSRAMLLSDRASAHARPQLEIYADDVRCTHGATVGHLDPESLFYLRSRGLDPTEARRFLLRGFAFDVLASLPDSLAGLVQDRVNEALSRLGEDRT